MDVSSTELLRIAATTLQNLALAWLIGLVSLRRWLVAKRCHREATGSAVFKRSALLASALLWALQFGLLWLEAAVMGDVALTNVGSVIVDVLGGTHYGIVWAIGFAVATTLFVMFALIGTASVGLGHALALASLIAAFVCTRSLLGHAADRGDFNWFVFLDWSHLLLIGAWVGEVLVATLLVVPRLNGAFDGRDTAAFATALSNSATFILIGVLFTGVIKAWISVDSPGNLTGTTYGTVLLVKLVFVSLAIALGGFNRYFVLPKLALVPSAGMRSDQRRFLVVLQVESFVLICAMVAAAVLSASALPMNGAAA